MLDSHKVFLYDRIKETSFTLGTSSFTLNGAADGFSSFGSVYSNGENVFYAATDGTFYEVGSGVYVTGVQNSLTRFPFRSSNNNQIVSFGEGLKEVFVTYPATNSVFSASGLQGQSQPQSSGLAFWSSSHILNYDSNIVWNSELSRLGIKKSAPVFAIDIGGDAPESIIRSSGLFVRSSGIFFPSGNNGDSSYLGGRQLAHYEPNVLNPLTGSDQVLELSGVAKNNVLFKQQNAGLVFAGPASGCAPPCSPDYPSFRPLILKDVHELDGFASVTLFDNINETGFRFDKPVGVGTIPRESTKLFVYAQNSTNSAFISSFSHSTSSTIRDSNVSLIANSVHRVDAGVDITNGSATAGSFFSLRNGVSGDKGTISGIYGVYIGYGNDSGIYANQNPTTKNAYGLYVAPFDGSGTIHNAYDIYLADAGIGSGVINQHYGIYQEGFSKKNVFQGFVNIQGSGTPSSAAASGDVGDIRWDANYVYLCIAPSTWKRAFISTW
jgi:hypothetical protein